MSIINQVLKDLDQQRGPADGLQIAALQGIGLVQSKHTQWPGALTSGAFGLALVALVLVLFQLAGGVTVDVESAESVPMEDPAPVKTSNTRPEIWEKTPDLVVETSVQALPEEAEIADAPLAIEKQVAPAIKPAVQTLPRTVKTLSPRQKAEHAFVAGQRAVGAQDKVRAEQFFYKALEYQPEHTDARVQLAGVYLDRGQDNQAKRVLETGLSLDPTQARLARLYAQLLATENEFDLALQALAPVTDTPTPDAESLALRAAIHARLDNHGGAASSYRLALKLDPEQANWWMGLGLALEHQALYSGATEAYQEAYRLPLADNVKVFVRRRLEQLQNPVGSN